MRPPYAVETVVNSRGQVIYQHAPRPRRLMSRAVAYVMTGALRGVLQYGTGKNAARMGLEFSFRALPSGKRVPLEER